MIWPHCAQLFWIWKIIIHVEHLPHSVFGVCTSDAFDLSTVYDHALDGVGLAWSRAFVRGRLFPASLLGGAGDGTRIVENEISKQSTVTIDKIVNGVIFGDN